MPAIGRRDLIRRLKFKARDGRRVMASVIEYMRKIAGYTGTDYRTSKGMAKELNITQILDKIRDYKRNWLHHTNRLPRLIKKKTTDQQAENSGETIKRLLEV